MGEVETQRIRRDKRSLLLHMVAQHLLQGIVEQVGCCMVSGTSLAFVCINTCHEVGLGMLGQLLDNMNALVVLALGVDNLYGLMLTNEHTLITYLTTHLAIERGVVEYQFIVGILLLRYLTITQDMTFIFVIVVTHELLLTLLELYPVAILHLCGITGTFFLLLHLHIELLLINGKTVLTTNQFGEVERETIGVEQAEGIRTAEDSLLMCLQFIHGPIQQVDTTVEGTQEGVFLFLDDTGDQLLLSLQFRIGFAHLMYQCGNELEQERILLVEEGIGIAYGTAQNTTDNVACLGITGQLTVGNGEAHGTDMVGNHTHGHICISLRSGILQTRETFNLFDHRLEYIGIVVGVLALDGAHQSFEAHTGIDHVHGELLQ